MKKIFYIFYKDFSSELRMRFALNALIMFVVVAVSTILFSLGSESVAPNVYAGMFWVVVFFSAMSGLSRVFVSEEERGTTLILSLIANPVTVFLGKFLFNLVLIFFINSVIALLYMFLFQEFLIQNWNSFLLAYVLGNFGISASSTIIAAIISKANVKGTLYPVLAFPVLLPLILMLIEITKSAMEGNPISDVEAELLVLISYDVVMITASILVFDIIWRD
ncbi:MAG: heme exporter protein CcmB [Ignavibacteria bacterium]|nr:heme exporter protein CcmB [Ignavibacteria bacterium]